MTNDVSGSLWDRYDEQCEQFESALRNGEAPAIESYLPAEGKDRAWLMRHLVELEIDYRTRKGEEVTLADYHDRFPELDAVEDTAVRPQALHDTNPPSSVTLQAGGIRRDFDTVNLGDPDTATAAADSPTRFGKYEILGELGRGGMGVVLRARDRELDRTVALKVISSNLAADDPIVKRFRLEAQAAAKLDHSNIVPVFEAGAANDRHFIALGYIAGDTLSDRIRRHPLSPRSAADILMKIALGVEYAHRQGVVHRDLKPANILMDRQGEPHITDFGLAKQLRGSSQLTMSGQVLGTPSYMAPEQAMGDQETVGPSADIYALGAVLYATLTGRPPFQAATIPATLHQVAHATAPSPRTLNAEVPKDLDTICMRCLEKEPQKRYATAQEVADELRRFVDGKPILARPVSTFEQAWRWAKRNPTIALLSSGMIASLIGGIVVSSALAWQATVSAAKERKARTDAELAQAKEKAAKEQAQNETTRAIAIREFVLLDMLNKVSHRRAGANVTLAEVLDLAAATVEQRFGDEPEIELAVRATLARAFLDVGQPRQAAEQLKAIDDDRLASEKYLDEVDLSSLQSLRGLILTQHGKLDAALKEFSDGYQRLESTLGPQHAATLSMRHKSVETLQTLERYEEALQELDAIAAVLEKLGVPDSLNQPQKSKRRSTAKIITDPDHRVVYISVLSSYAGILMVTNKTEQAEAYTIKLAEAARKLNNPITAANAHHQYASLLDRRQEYAAAAQQYAKSITIMKQYLAPEDLRLAFSYYGLGMTLYRLKRYKDAEKMLLKTYTRFRDLYGPRNHRTERVMGDLCNLYSASREFDKLVLFARKILLLRLRFAEPEDERTVKQQFVRFDMACLQARGPAGSVKYRNELTQELMDLENSDSRKARMLTHWGMAVLINVQWKDRLQHAEPILKRALAIYRDSLGLDNKMTQWCLGHLINLYEIQGNAEQVSELRKLQQ